MNQLINFRYERNGSKNNDNLNPDEIRTNGISLVDRIAASAAQLQKEKEEQAKLNQNMPNGANPSEGKELAPQNEIKANGSGFSFKHEGSKESFGGKKEDKGKKKNKKSKKDKSDKKSKENSPEKPKDPIMINDELACAEPIKAEEVKEEVKKEENKEPPSQDEPSKPEEIKAELNQSFNMEERKKSREAKSKRKGTKKRSKKRMGTGSKAKIDEEEVPLDLNKESGKIM